MPSPMKGWVWRDIVMALICVGSIALPAFAAEPVALRGYKRCHRRKLDFRHIIRRIYGGAVRDRMVLP